MGILVPNAVTGSVHDSTVVQAVDDLMEKAKHKPVWETVHFIVMRWYNLHPQEAADFVQAVKEQKQIQKDQYGSTGRTKNGNIKGIGLRNTLIVPDNIKYAVDMLLTRQIKEYKNGEKGFWREFCKRYQQFSLAEKL